MTLNIKVLPVLLLLLVVSEFVQCGKSPSGRAKISKFMLGASPASISEFPHHLGLMEKDYYFCGATSISGLFAISGAHCFHFGDYNPMLYIRGGTSHSKEGGQIVGIEYYLLHPKFDKTTMDYDVAIVKAERPLDFPLISPAPLPEPCLSECCKTCPETTVKLAGWGLTETFRYSDKLLKINQSIMASSPVCEDAWDIVTPRMFCVKVEKGKDSCNGDNGGGVLLENGILVGIISYGALVCGGGDPSVYTRLENIEIRDWIKNNTGI